MHTPLVNYFNKVATINEREEALVRELFTSQSYKRKAFVLQEGEICKTFTFVVSGCLRLYKIDDKGNYHILSFASENWLVVDILSFREQTPAILTIDALEATEVLQITNENLQRLYREAPIFNYIIRELLEKHLAFLQYRLLDMMYANAQERYASFVRQYPHLLNRISHAQIAYYLGITPEFLSKIRSSN